MSLYHTILEDLKTAQLAREEDKLSVLRLIKAAVMKWETSGKEKTEAGDDEVLKIVQKEAKQRKDSIAAFEGGGRPELAEKEKLELAIIEAYLPEQMPEAEVRKLAEETVKEVGASSRADQGQVMKALMPKLKGQADGKLVAQIVGELLS